MFVSYNLIFSATIVTVAALALGLRAYLKSEQP